MHHTGGKINKLISLPQGSFCDTGHSCKLTVVYHCLVVYYFEAFRVECIVVIFFFLKKPYISFMFTIWVHFSTQCCLAEISIVLLSIRV